MGSEKSTGTTQTTQSYTPSAAELQQQQNLADITSATKGQQIDVNKAGLLAVNQLLTGQALPGYLSGLPGGISPDVTNSIVNYSLRDVNNQLAASGAGTMMESGASQQAGVRAAADIRNQAAQYNLNNLMQLLNIGVGGSAQVQQPIQGYSSQLSGLVKGTGTTQGNYNTSTLVMNPFVKSFQTNMGNTFGKPAFSAGPFGFGG